MAAPVSTYEIANLLVEDVEYLQEHGVCRNDGLDRIYATMGPPGILTAVIVSFVMFNEYREAKRPVTLLVDAITDDDDDLLEAFIRQAMEYAAASKWDDLIDLCGAAGPDMGYSLVHGVRHFMAEHGTEVWRASYS